ncbi:MAG: transcriptional regulator, TetR family [Glaciihabitans sp.]|nr:transcriptional regulator, TetR family [Glaciihabitans sp.]
MKTSAAGLGLRERQGIERREAIARSARNLTAERGFNGFTVEELCESVGISRRTFFNYFPSKEQAIFGRPEDGLEDDAAADFVANRDRSPVLPSLVGLGINHLVSAGLTQAEAANFATIIEREPQLLATALNTGNKRDALLAILVAEREGTTADDPSVLLAVQLAGTIVRSAVMDFLFLNSPSTLEDLAASRLAIARALFTA